MSDGAVTRRSWRWLRGRASPALGRGLWGAVDQALSSASNFVLGLLVIRNVSVEDFGLYSLLFVTYILFLGTTRTLFGQPLTIRLPTTGAEVERDRCAVLGGALALGCIGGLFVLGASALAPSSAPALIAFAAVLPGLLVQDAYRLAFFAFQNPRAAAANDLVWTVAMFSVAVPIAVFGKASVATLILCWGGGATVAAVYGWRQCRTRPAPLVAWRFVSRHRDLSAPLLGDFWAQQGVTQLTTYGLGFVASVAAVGRFRGAALLMGPVNLLTNALGVVMLPELSRLRHGAVPVFRRTLIVFSVLLAGATMAWGAAFLALPSEWGTFVVGPTWNQLGGVILPFAAARAGTGALWGAVIGCRALEAASGMLRTRLIASPIVVLGTLIGAARADARGAAIGMAVGTWLAVALWWLQYRDAERTWRHSNGGTVDGDLASPSALETVPLATVDRGAGAAHRGLGAPRIDR